MIENKRFMLDDCGELIDLNNHAFVDYGDGVCNLLNELHDENKQLKKEYNSLQRTAYKIDAIAHEDREYSERLYKQNQQLEKENEQLKEEKELIKQKLLKYVLDYDKISNDNWNMGLSESVETLQEEVESLFENPSDWEYEFDCCECKYFKEIKDDFDEANCLKHNKKIDYWDYACEKFEWK